MQRSMKCHAKEIKAQGKKKNFVHDFFNSPVINDKGD